VNTTSNDSTVLIKAHDAVPGAGLAAAWVAAAEQNLKRLRALLSSAAPGDVIRDAADVRALAYRHLKSDPGFAADLFAAADRHERLNANEP
jgi:hypothetical protein